MHKPSAYIPTESRCAQEENHDHTHEMLRKVERGSRTHAQAARKDCMLEAKVQVGNAEDSAQATAKRSILLTRRKESATPDTAPISSISSVILSSL